MERWVVENITAPPNVTENLGRSLCQGNHARFCDKTFHGILCLAARLLATPIVAYQRAKAAGLFQLVVWSLGIRPIPHEGGLCCAVRLGRVSGRQLGSAVYRSTRTCCFLPSLAGTNSRGTNAWERRVGWLLVDVGTPGGRLAA
jgi:hypothetical protein